MAYPFESDWGLPTPGRLRRALHKVVALPNVPLPDLLLLAALANPESKAKLETEAGYFATNHERMQYRDFQQALLPIGSGTVESGAKQAKHRLAAQGMRWSRPDLENMLPLRAAVMSGTFDLLWPVICPR